MAGRLNSLRPGFAEGPFGQQAPPGRPLVAERVATPLRWRFATAPRRRQGSAGGGGTKEGARVNHCPSGRLNSHRPLRSAVPRTRPMSLGEG